MGGSADTLRSEVQALRAAGKNVLISVGGELFNDPSIGWTPSKYKICNENVLGLVSQIVTWVNRLGASGVDIDYEDSNAFIDPGDDNYSGYNGVSFLTALTAGLYQYLPANGNIITHAPAPGYWDTNSAYNAAYYDLNSQVGNYIAWYNTQFYDNPPYSTDDTSKVKYYEQFAREIGPGKLLMGVSLNPNDTGYISSLGDMTQNVIGPLQAKFPPTPQLVEFGGVMTWEFEFDNGGGWGTGIAEALMT